MSRNQVCKFVFSSSAFFAIMIGFLYGAAIGQIKPKKQFKNNKKYHLIEQVDAMRAIARFETVTKKSSKKTIQQLKQFKKDPESLYLLMIVHSIRNEPAKALAYAEKAVNAGLPFERILAGPREMLTSLYANDEFKAWLKSQNVMLLHGPMLGSVTDSTAKFWVRTAKELDVSVEIKTADGSVLQSNIQCESMRTKAVQDYTATIQVTGLQPETVYTYQAIVDGKKVGESATFRTFSRLNNAAKFSVVFGGGARVIPENERMWDTIAAKNPLAMLLLGDNVYIDDPIHAATQKYCYYRRQSQPEWKRFAASTAIYAVYDDHDFGTNDCVPGPEIENPTWKRKAWSLFKNNWNNPAYGGGRTNPGCWFDFQIGDVHFIFIDGRYYRDLNGKSMLGPVQKKWLKKTLKNSKSTFKVFASDVPWTADIKPGSLDTWDGFSKEREEIFSFIEQEKIEGVMLISADRHRSDFFKIARPKGYDFYEFQSSRLTNRHTHPIVKSPGHIYSYNKNCSFGLLEFDTTKADPQIKLSIININGKVKHSIQVSRSQLMFKK